MALLVTILAFALVASLYSTADAGWFRKDAKRTDLGEDCPSCNGPPCQHGKSSKLFRLYNFAHTYRSSYLARLD